jgi:hypothetical protein
MPKNASASAQTLCPFCNSYFKSINSHYAAAKRCGEQYQAAQEAQYNALLKQRESSSAHSQPSYHVSHSPSHQEAGPSKRPRFLSPEHHMEVDDSQFSTGPEDAQSSVPEGLHIYEQRLFPDAGRIIGQEETFFQHIKHKWPHAHLPEHPFASRAEWSLVEWLGTSGISNIQIDSLLQTQWVSKNLPVLSWSFLLYFILFQLCC